MVGVGLDYRYPFVAHTGSTSHVIEPVGQIIARGGQANNSWFPSRMRKASSSTTRCCSTSTSSPGYDQIETGTRTNFGVQYTFAEL